MTGIPATNRPSMYEPPTKPYAFNRWSRVCRFARHAAKQITHPSFVVGVILAGLVIGCLAVVIWRSL